MKPYYSSAIGKLWLERGGTCVQANIRGGGEFGTRWHDAGRYAGKRLAHDDFAAVAADLVRRGVTRPDRIAAEGGSNGGILISNMLTRYPERFGALFCTIPLIDMRRYTKLLAGASWIAEYGDPDKPEEWAWLQTYSAYHAAKPGQKYPPILIATTRRDDRVHPGHARKMTAKLQAMGYEAYFYEPAAGGHGYGKDNKGARRVHRAWLYVPERQDRLAGRTRKFPRRSNTRIRLLAGIGTVSINAKPNTSGQLLDIGDVAHAPFGIAVAQAGVEHRIAERGVLAVALERPVEKQPPVGAQIARRACEQALGDAPRRDVDHIGAEHRQQGRGPLPSCISGHHAGSERSIRSGGRIFASPACARHAAMLFRCCSLRSLGHQMMSGVWRAKSTTCWPVPLPASTTSPDLPARNFCSTAQIGAWLRWNAAASRRPSGSTGRPSLPNSTTYSATTLSLPVLDPLLRPSRHCVANPGKPRLIGCKPGNHFAAFPGATRESIPRNCRADCPHCQPMAFMLFTPYIPRGSSP